MNDDQLLRHSRHLLLQGIGVEGVQRWMEAHVLVIGAGGLGSPVLMFLASAGVGHVTVVDDDTVALTNLQRQIAHRTVDVDQPKVQSAARAMTAINPEVRVTTHQARVNGESLRALVAASDVVIDCTDNFATRQAVNAACVTMAKPLVFGAAIGFDAQVSVFDTRRPDSPCYACLFPPGEQPEEAQCATMGVFAPIVGIVGSMQAAEALKLLGDIGEPLVGTLSMLDARSMTWTPLRIGRRAGCDVCGHRHLP